MDGICTTRGLPFSPLGREAFVNRANLATLPPVLRSQEAARRIENWKNERRGRIAELRRERRRDSLRRFKRS